MMKRLLATILAIGLGASLKASDAPLVVNYDKYDIKAAARSLSISQSSDGIIYFANEGGLLYYDGSRWCLHPLPFSSRSVCVTDRDIAIGGVGECGFLRKDSFGELQYSKVNLPDGEEMVDERIISILARDERVLFQGSHNIFEYDRTSGLLSRTPSPSRIVSMAEESGRIYLFTVSDGMMEYEEGSMKTVFERTLFPNSRYIRAMIPMEDRKAMLFGDEGTVYTINLDDTTVEGSSSSVADCLPGRTLNRALATGDGNTIIVGTPSDGMFAFGRDLNLLWHLGLSNGLGSNDVLSILEDNSGNLWCCGANCISLVNLTDGLSASGDLPPETGSVYDIASLGNRRYYATNKGLYYSVSGSQGGFHLVPQTRGHVINELYRTDNSIIAGDASESIVIEADGAIYTLNSGGVRCSRQQDDILIQSGITGLYMFRKVDGRWSKRLKVRNCRYKFNSLEIDWYNHYVWAAGNDRGLYRLKMSDSWHAADSIVYYPFDGRRVCVSRINDNIAVLDGRSIRIYDYQKDDLVEWDYLNGAIGHLRESSGVFHAEGNRYWFHCRNELALVDVKPGKPEVGKSLDLTTYRSGVIDGHEKIVTTSVGCSYVCTDRGYIRIDYAQPSANDYRPALTLERVESTSRDGNAHPIVFHDKDGNIRIDVHRPSDGFIVHLCYADFLRKHHAFRYKLRGLDHDWHITDDISSISYLRVPHGHYSLDVEVTGMCDEVLGRLSVPVTVDAPFWLCGWGLLIYLALASALAAAIYKIADHRAMNRVIREDNTKLTNEVAGKSQELANLAITLVHKDNILYELRDDLKTMKDSPTVFGIDKLIRKLDTSISSDENWTLFLENFNSIYNGFADNLLKAHPSLSPSDIKICLLLVLNMSTKEIADFLHISIRGLETARHRLRKKLGLAATDDIRTYLNSLKNI